VNFLIHILIPAYGKSEHLFDAIDSILRAEFNELCKITIVDDASPTTEIKKIAELFDGKVEYLRNKENLGIGKNFQNCHAISEGKLTIIMGSDDRIRANALKELINLHNTSPDSILYQLGVETINSGGEKVTPFVDKVKFFISPRNKKTSTFYSKNLLWRLALGNFMFFPAIAWNSKYKKDILWTTEYELAVDIKLLHDLAIKNHLFTFGHSKVFEYRRHSENSSLKLYKNGKRIQEELSVNYQTSIKFNWKRNSVLKLILIAAPIIRIHGFHHFAKSIFRNSKESRLILRAVLMSPKRAHGLTFR